MSPLRMSTVLGAVLIMFTGLGHAAGAGFSVFVSIDGVPGDSTEAGHPQWTVVKYFHYRAGVESPSEERPAVRGNTLVIAKETDSGTPELFYRMTTGHRMNVVLDCCKVSGDRLEVFLRLELRDVRVTRVEMSGSPEGGATTTPVEEVHLTFGTITCTSFMNVGRSGVPVARTWSFPEE